MAKETATLNAALVLQGGGTRSAFTAGVLDVLMERDVAFPYVIGTSAGALNMVNYLSKDIGRSKTIVTKTMHDPKFVSLKNYVKKGGMFDFAYLFHTVPKTSVPFNAAAFNGSEVRAIAATVCLETGQPAYFEKGATRDFYKAIAASASLPLISKPVTIQGQHYLDGGIGAAVPFKKALEDGYKKIVIVETRAEGYRKPSKQKHKLLSKWLYRRYPNFLTAYSARHRDYNRDQDELDSLGREGLIFRIRPDNPPCVKVVEKDEIKLLALYEEGRKVMERELNAMFAYLEGHYE